MIPKHPSARNIEDILSIRKGRVDEDGGQSGIGIEGRSIACQVRLLPTRLAICGKTAVTVLRDVRLTAVDLY